MTRLVWIGDGSEGALSDETRALLSSGSPLVKGIADHPAYAVLESQGFHLSEPSGSDRILVFPGDGPGPGLPLYQLVEVSDRLLAPGGCPWDRAQTHESLKKYLLEETYEVLEAIDSGSDEKLKEELGDLILQPVMHAQMKKAAGEFDIDDVANEIVLKLVRRHPHVFGDVSAEDPDEVLKNWDRIKRTEKGDEPRSILAGVPKGMASLLRAHEISKRAARSGFEWPDIEAVFDKLHEEEAELKEAIAAGDRKHIESEIGDLLFTAVNIARWAGIEPEDALRQMLDRFSKRFAAMEAAAHRPLPELSPEEWDRLWNEAKRLSDPA
ncbi:MAG TPA: nucleoside triphosphate pyrophosphohydrolase [Fimbriimonadaceae bacterium]|nr:nucleoside triphosphate pyrophosphohydrolase [Fimbriimonadaceae bacterium]